MDEQLSKSKGYVLITALIVLVVTTGLVMGFVSQVNTQQKIGLNDVNYGNAFYAAEAGLEKLNSDLSKEFYVTVYPSSAQLQTIQGSSYQPGFPGVTYATYQLTGGQTARLNGALNATATSVTVDSTANWPSTGYFMVDAESITYTGLTATTFTGLTRGALGTTAASHVNAARVSRSQVVTIAQGQNAGLNAQVIPFTLQVIARTNTGTEVKLNRDVQVALVPVFQFGVFSDSDLSFFAGPDFNFGGRVHTNGNLFLAEGNGKTLTLAQKVTAALEVIRAQLSNGYVNGTNYAGTVNVVTSPGVYRALALTEGSVTGGPGSSANGGWPALSNTTYNKNILSSGTGAKPLTLPFAGPGISPVELIRRAPVGEDPLSILSESRLANQASLRILISDAVANLPGGTGYPLNTALYGAPYNYTADATHPPLALADSTDPDFVTATNADETAATPLIDGFIRIDMQKNDNTWQDVTMEILNLGMAVGNANAVLRFERLKPTKAAGSTTATDYMPLNLYDPREARFRDSAVTGLRKMGIMGLVELDVNNLRRWFAGSIGANGNQALNNSGFILYFSDRRGNRDAGGNETAEFGFEDIVNSGDAANGVPNNSLQTGEDFNGNTTLETYGANQPVTPFTAYPTNTDLYTTPVDGQSTTLAAAMASATNPANGGTITVASTSGWTAPGFIVVDNEAITFTGMTATTFTGITRGAYGSTAAGHGNGSTVTIGQTTTLSANINSTAGTISVSSTAGWPSWGYLLVGSEYITYTGKTATTFTGATRGVWGSTAASHNNGDVASNSNKAKKNRVWYFRRALRLINGAAPNLPTPGFTVASENPVYVQGDYNAAGSFTGAHSYAAVIADAVTLLSNNWNDDRSFDFPYSPGSRNGTTTWYRLAIAAGKGISFPQPAGAPQDYGTDGGTHNFLRYIEGWSGTLNYLGSIVSLYTSRQATGTYKCCTVVYGPPTRAYAFDTEFLVPSQLPPGTPRFRDINNLSFRQNILSNQ